MDRYLINNSGRSFPARAVPLPFSSPLAPMLPVPRSFLPGFLLWFLRGLTSNDSIGGKYISHQPNSLRSQHGSFIPLQSRRSLGLNPARTTFKSATRHSSCPTFPLNLAVRMLLRTFSSLQFRGYRHHSIPSSLALAVGIVVEGSKPVSWSVDLCFVPR